MDIEEKKLHIQNILKANNLFDDLLDLKQDVLNFRPARDRWTIHEHVIHCLDVDIANFTRYRIGIVEPGTEIIGMDDRWTEMLNYSSLSLDEAIQTIKLIRKLTHSHFSTIQEEDWTTYSFLYKKYGDLNFEVFVPVFFRHPIAHREMIDKLLLEYNETNET